MNINNYNFLQKRILDVNTHLERLEVKLLIQDKEYAHSPYSNDFILNVDIQNIKYIFNVIVKKRLEGNSAIQLINNKSYLSNDQNILFVGEYISPKIEEYLLNNDISFINTSGNVFVHKNSLLLYFDYPIKSKKNEISGAAFEPAGLKFVFHLLNKPGSISKSYRVLSDIVGVSSGSISKIIKDLKKNGFLYTLKKKRVLRNKDKLLDQWYVAYGRKLRPKSLVAKYRTIEQPRDVTLPKGCYWGGEVAAEILNMNLRSKDQILYTEIDPLVVVKKLCLIPDEKGKLELVRAFWKPDIHYQHHINTVTNALIYADLMLSQNDRNIEIANELLQ